MSDNYGAMYNKAYALQYLNKSEATEWYKKILTVDKNDLHAMNSLGVIQFEFGKPNEAIDWYDRILGIDKNNTSVLNNKAIALISTGNLEEGVKLLDSIPNLAQTANTSIDMIADKAFVLGIGSKEYDEALSIIEANRNSKNANLLCVAIAIYKEIEDIAQAEMFEKQLPPDYQYVSVLRPSMSEPFTNTFIK